MAKDDPAIARMLDAMEVLQAECAHLRATLHLCHQHLLGQHPLPHEVVLERVEEVLGRHPKPTPK